MKDGEKIYVENIVTTTAQQGYIAWLKEWVLNLARELPMDTLEAQAIC